MNVLLTNWEAGKLFASIGL